MSKVIKNENKKKSNTSLNIFSFLIGLTVGSCSFLALNPIISYYFNSFNGPAFIKKNSTNQEITTETIQVMFTPGDQCTDRIVEHILSAKKEILVQAYSFTSKPIIDALISKRKEGVKIIIILDKSQEKSVFALKVYSSEIQVLIDKMPGIAHNKIIIIDRKKIFTGSFNFSKAAQFSNAENSLLIYDAKTVKKYLENFFNRMEKSSRYSFEPIQSKL
ncbi:phospholipase D-like domain-containing protein [Alphaproteobacteria bacterium endosymbiont of Tiliacea citrago]|uniref:phospholipase D-like domain-containing protein n=1 Tax=Alphaproteobacteria bacterium endosymbiont of Tiliacea citrago TaxID=3077944 RepID=UPI00313B1440